MIKKIALLGGIVLLTLLFIYCTTDESTIIGPFGSADKHLSVASLSVDKPKVYSKGDSSIVSIKVLDINNSPAIGLKIDFSVQFGSITKSDITDSSGIAIATFTSDENTGENIITIDVGIKKYTIPIEVINYQPTYIELSAGSLSLLADGTSSTIVTAVLKDSVGSPMPDVTVNFTTTLGILSDQIKKTDANGVATTVLTSAGSSSDKTAVINVYVAIDASISDDINLQFRGIAIITQIDSAKMSDNGIYEAYIRANLFEDTNGASINTGAVYFSSTVGTMNDLLVAINGQGKAFSVFKAEVLSTNQNNIVITSELSSSSEVSSVATFDIPGAEMLINTIDDSTMGDGEGWALVKATLREIDGKAITKTQIGWSTTLGTIIGQSKTNTSGHTIDTLRIENSVSVNTDVTISANYGNNISASDIITFIPPINLNRLILGFEPDTTGEVGITAQFVDENANPKSGQIVNFSVVPNNLASIFSPDNTDTNGLASVMMVYPPQNGGEIVRVWGEAPDGTKGSIDVVLP